MKHKVKFKALRLNLSNLTTLFKLEPHIFLKAAEEHSEEENNFLGNKWFSFLVLSTLKK